MTCEKCSGNGYVRYAEAFSEREFCDCSMGRDVQRVDARAERQRLAVERDLAEFNARPRSANLLFGADHKMRAAGDTK